jgi:ATP-dependent exoDNAse (exonuclease V) beta subunit
MSVVWTSTDADARRRIRDDIDQTLVVEAAAGTGKTTELVNRILHVIAQGRASIREIVAVTFTEKAAGELKLRLRQGLERERAGASDAETASRLDDAVQNLEEAHVSTIHGFCADLLRERPVEARVDPLFRVLTEGQAERLFDEAFSGWFQEHLGDPPMGVRRSLRRPSRGFKPGEVDEDGPMERLRRAGFDLTQWRDFRAAWTREPFDREGAAARLVELIHTLADLSQRPSYVNDNLFLDTAPVRRLSTDLRAAHGSGAAQDLDALEAQLVELRRNRDFRRARKGSGPGYSKGIPRAGVLEARDAVMLALDDFQQRADAELSALLHEELLACVDRYEALKKREGALDFLDLLLKARDLVRDNGDVRRHFQSRFTRIFVDEFQDTDPLQAELLLLLASRDPDETRWRQIDPVPGKLFLVGDPKQSIYRFRRADVLVYEDVCTQLTDRGAQRVELRRSFRAVPNIQRTVNAAFSAVMDGSIAGGASYMPLEPDRHDHPEQPSVVALPVPEPYAHRFVAAREIERSLPDAVGAYAEWLIRESGWTVTERRDPARRVPIEARHICILFRRFVSYGEDITRPYVEALEARGIRHLLVGGKAFHDREEIETLRAALMAIEWPDDQLSVFATLRGPLFAIGDEDLLEYHYLSGLAGRAGEAGGTTGAGVATGVASRRDGRFHPFRIPPDLPEWLSHVREALSLLAALHKQRNRVPVADTISQLLQQTRAHVGFVLRPGGEQALANVLHVAELARQYELDGGMSFRGFVDVLREAASAGQASEAPILEEGADGVRLMTVHKAKGLEFPVVILGDITARLTPYDATRYVDPERGLCALRIGGWSPKDLTDHREDELERERAEAGRVAYVAATRARDLLVVPAVGDDPYAEGWVSPLNSAIYPADDVRRTQAEGPGCPAFTSRDSVLRRPDGDPATRLTVCPGAHTLGSPGLPHTVVWWSPSDLSLNASPAFGIRRQELIVKDVSPAVLKTYRDEYDQWRSAREAALDTGRRPSISVVTATEAAARWPDGSADKSGGLREAEEEFRISVEHIEPLGERPGGVRFGTLVHALLSDVPLAESGPEVLERLADAHGRVLGATASERASARELVARTLGHPVLQAAARAASRGQCYRETPVTLRADDRTIIEGHVDLVFADGDEFVVVDFKTDRDREGTLDQYRAQVRIYAAAVSRATGRRARAVLMNL